MEHVYETVLEPTVQDVEGKAAHNDSSVSSASQLLENPSPLSWAFCSPPSDFEGEFTLKRQRGIRRKRQTKDKNGQTLSKRAKHERLPFVEAVNRHVKRLALETDLDSEMMVEDNSGSGSEGIGNEKMEDEEAEERKEEMEVVRDETKEEEGETTKRTVTITVCILKLLFSSLFSSIVYIGDLSLNNLGCFRNKSSVLLDLYICIVNYEIAITLKAKRGI